MTIHEHHVSPAGNMVEVLRYGRRHVPNRWHDGLSSFGFDRIVDIRDKKPLDSFSETIEDKRGNAASGVC